MSETKVLYQWTSGETRLRIVEGPDSYLSPILEAAGSLPVWEVIDPVERVVASEIVRLAAASIALATDNARLTRELEDENRRKTAPQFWQRDGG